MKRLEFSDLEAGDGLYLSFEGFFDPSMELEDELPPLLQSLEDYADGWMPDLVEGKRQRRYSRTAFWKSLEEARTERTASLVLGRTKWPAVYMWPRLSFPPLAPKVRVTLEVQPLSFLASEERCQQFVSMVRAWACRYTAKHASAQSGADFQLSGAPSFGRDDETLFRDGFDKIYEVSWLNVFGPKLVEAVGRERMLSTPAWRVEELPNGAVLLVTRPTVADFASDEAREAQARAHVHLRPDLDLDSVRRALRERSAALVPVEPHFPPDIAPLLWRHVDRVPFHERQRKIAEFNPYQPPEPTEWLPADASLPVDVEDPASARADYAALAGRLPGLFAFAEQVRFDGTPESLTAIDYQFWHESFPRVFQREHVDAHAVPVVGAYLGEVLVRHLGGQWLPRQALMETQVRVGTRVWLPFARAWNYLRSCESLLDSSLTQLHRVAERHRS